MIRTTLFRTEKVGKIRIKDCRFKIFFYFASSWGQIIQKLHSSHSFVLCELHTFDLISSFEKSCLNEKRIRFLDLLSAGLLDFADNLDLASRAYADCIPERREWVSMINESRTKYMKTTTYNQS